MKLIILLCLGFIHCLETEELVDEQEHTIFQKKKNRSLIVNSDNHLNIEELATTFKEFE